MAHIVEDFLSMSSTCSDDFQTASEGLDQITPSQLKAILRRNGIETAASTEITNPFTASQLRANLEHHKKTYPQPDEDPWPSCSGSTNAFTSIQLQIIHGPHVYSARSAKKTKKTLGTKHPALQGPVLEPGPPSSRSPSIPPGDPKKRGIAVAPDGPRRSTTSGKPTKLARYLDHHKSRKQVRIASQSKPNKGNRIHVLERGESSRQGSRAGAQVERSLQGTQLEASPAAEPPARGHRQSITRASLKLGSELLNISTQKIGLSEEHVLHTTKEVALTQSQHDFGVRLCIAKLPSEDTCTWKALTWPLELDLFFDPNSDAVLLVNNTILDTRELLVIVPMAPGKKPTKIGALEKAALESSSSYAFFVSNRHMFDISVLPRRYVASTSAPLRLLTQSGKRAVDVLSQQAMPSAAKRTKTMATHGQPKACWKGEIKQTEGLAKDKGKGALDLVRDNSKGKGKATDDATDESEATDVPETDGRETPDGQEATDPSNASTIVQPQSSNELVLASTSPFPSGSSLRAGYISAANHPLNDLPENASIKIANATREGDYTLVRRDNIARQANTLVFKANHSKIPGKLVAVKIWHSVFDLDFVPGAGVKVISQVSEYYVREVKNHMKVSEHPTIASLYSFDVRLLALYIEHIDACDLANCRQPGKNPYCTLDDSDAERVLHDMAGALEFIHGKDVVHNDIKPSNILYSKERGPVLIDFGWSTDSETVHVAGSPWYVPPEYPRDGTRGPAGDIFAFGIVMLFLMRKIPLPELLSPPLRWHIGHLRSKGPEALEALEKMTRWVRMIEGVLDQVQSIHDGGEGGLLEVMVPRIAGIEFRLTGPEIVYTLLEQQSKWRQIAGLEEHIARLEAYTS
ncbi:hypothetical protein V8C26DRAFT_391947 [Trichoderma gracile]